MNYKRREIKREKEEPLLRGHQPAEQRRPGRASADWELRDCCSGVDWSCTEEVLEQQQSGGAGRGTLAVASSCFPSHQQRGWGHQKLRGAGCLLKPQGYIVSLIFPGAFPLPPRHQGCQVPSNFPMHHPPGHILGAARRQAKYMPPRTGLGT